MSLSGHVFQTHFFVSRKQNQLEQVCHAPVHCFSFSRLRQFSRSLSTIAFVIRPCSLSFSLFLSCTCHPSFSAVAMAVLPTNSLAVLPPLPHRCFYSPLNHPPFLHRFASCLPTNRANSSCCQHTLTQNTLIVPSPLARL